MDLLLPNSRRYSNNSYCKSNIAVLRQNGAAAGQRRKKFEALKDITRAVSIAGLTDLVCPTDRCAASWLGVWALASRAASQMVVCTAETGARHA